MPGLKGALLGLKVNGVFISCEISCDFNFQVDMLPASAVDSARFKEFIPGMRSWSVSVNGQLLAEAAGADFKTIMEAVDKGYAVLVRIGTRPSVLTQMSVEGYAYPSQGGFTGSNKGNATWTMTFQGTSKYTTAFQNFQLLIDAMPSSADYPVVVDENVTG